MHYHLLYTTVLSPSSLYFGTTKSAKRSRSARRTGQVGVEVVVAQAADIGFRTYWGTESTSQRRGGDSGAEDIVVDGEECRLRLDRVRDVAVVLDILSSKFYSWHVCTLYSCRDRKPTAKERDRSQYYFDLQTIQDHWILIPQLLRNMQATVATSPAGLFAYTSISISLPTPFQSCRATVALSVHLNV